MLASCSALNIPGSLWALPEVEFSVIWPLRRWVREEWSPDSSVPGIGSSASLGYRLWDGGQGAVHYLTRTRPDLPPHPHTGIPKCVETSTPPGSDTGSCRFSGVYSHWRRLPNTGPCTLTHDYQPSRQTSERIP